MPNKANFSLWRMGRRRQLDDACPPVAAGTCPRVNGRWSAVRRRTEGGRHHGKETMRRPGAKNADYRGGVTCLYDTQLPGACLHASESGGRSRPEAVRGMPDVPVAPPATGPRRGRAHRRSLGWAVGLVSPAFLIRGLWARLLWVLGSFPLFLGSERVSTWVIDRF